jgi:putative membrane protein
MLGWLENIMMPPGQPTDSGASGNSPVDPRIYLAAERTFLAWIRTGIAFMGFGFVVARFGLFLNELALSNHLAVALPASGFSLPVGVAMIVAGILINLGAAVRHHRYLQALDQGRLPTRHGRFFPYLVAGFLAAMGLAVAIYLAFVLR